LALALQPYAKVASARLTLRVSCLGCVFGRRANPEFKVLADGPPKELGAPRFDGLPRRVAGGALLPSDVDRFVGIVEELCVYFTRPRMRPGQTSGKYGS